MSDRGDGLALMHTVETGHRHNIFCADLLPGSGGSGMDAPEVRARSRALLVSVLLLRLHGRARELYMFFFKKTFFFFLVPSPTGLLLARSAKNSRTFPPCRCSPRRATGRCG
jgi:hypothetical protein